VASIVAGTLSGIRADKFMIIQGARIRHLPGVSRALGDRAVANARRPG
jgi:hypothetical protein